MINLGIRVTPKSNQFGRIGIYFDWKTHTSIITSKLSSLSLFKNCHLGTANCKSYEPGEK